MESYELLWRETLPELEKTISSISYDTYIVNLTPVDIIGNRLILCTQSAIFADQINGRLKEKISDALSKSNSDVTEFQIIVAKDREEYVKKIEEDAGGPIDNAGSPINPKFTFDSFVVGSSNEFSYHAAKAVAHPRQDIRKGRLTLHCAPATTACPHEACNTCPLRRLWKPYRLNFGSLHYF